MPETMNKVPVDHPIYLRSEVVALFGESERLRQTVYVRRKNILECYGVSLRHFRKIVEAGTIAPKHFVFKEGGKNADRTEDGIC